MVEIAHHALELAFRHLAVGDRDARLGQERFELLAPVLDRLDLVVEIVGLAPALQLAQHRLAHDSRRKAVHERLDGEPALRRGGDDGEIAQALERHRERARNGRGGEREHVNLGAQLLQLLLLAHAEAVLLVDDHQPQVPELHVLLDQLVRADDDVERAGGESLEGLRHFLRAAEARELGDSHREVGEAIAEILEMLLGEERRRHEDRHLHARGDGDEGGAHCDLGLAEAHVAAHEPVHGTPRRHVADHRLDRARLVRGFLERESGSEAFVFLQREREREALPREALRVEVEKLRSGVAHLARGLALGLFPLAAAQPVQRRAFGRGSGIAADDVQLRDRHVELVAAFVFEVQEFHLALAEVERDEPKVAPDAVLAVHHRIAGLDLREVAHHPFGAAARARVAAARLAHLPRVELGLGDDRDCLAAQHEAEGDRTVD